MPVYDNCLRGAGQRTVNGRAYCSWFNFKSGDQQKKVGMLSGGERNR
jgi:sulfate-transporting ATPase